MTGMLAEKMQSHLERENVLPSEQKRCRKGSRGTKDQLLIDKTLLRHCKKRHTNLAMPWIDYKKPMTWYHIAGLVSAQKCFVFQRMYKTS